MRSSTVSCRIPPRSDPAPPVSGAGWSGSPTDGSRRGSPDHSGRSPKDGRGRRPPADVDPDSINLVGATHLEDVRDAAEWAASARFLSNERRAATTLLTDVLAIGAAEPLPAFLRGQRGEGRPRRLPRRVRSIRNAVAARGRPQLGGNLVRDGVEPARGRPPGTACRTGMRRGRGGDRRGARPHPGRTSRCDRGRLRHRKLAPRRRRDGRWRRPAFTHRARSPPSATAAAVGRLEGIGARNLAQSIRRASALTPLHPYRAFSDGASAKLLFGAFGQLLGASAALSIKNPIGLLPAPSLSRRSRQPGVASFNPRTATRAIHKVALKKFPGSRAVQSVLAAMEKMPRVDPGAVESISVETYPFSATVSGWSRPDTGPIAMQSHIPTAVALWLEARYRRVPFSADHYPRFRDPATITLAERVTVQAHEFGQAGAPSSSRIRWARVTVRSRTGPDLTASSGPPFAPPPPGAIPRPLREPDPRRGRARPAPVPLLRLPFAPLWARNPGGGAAGTGTRGASTRGARGLREAAASEPDSGADSLFGRS